MAFFDFHIHPALKSQFNDVDKRDNPWTTLKMGLGIIDSQSSLSQLAKGQLNMMGFVLHCPESHMASELGRLLTAEDLALKIWRCIDKRTFKRVTAKASIDRLEFIGSGIHNYAVIKEELDNMLTHLSDPNSNKKVKFMTKAADYNAGDTDTIHAFVIIEGLHCFNGEASVDSGEGQEQLMNNMKDFLSRDDCKVFAINLSHLQNDGIANHAFGLKLFDEKLFFPTGDGLNMPLAQEVIDEIYSRNIIIDIKHLSIKARQQFYDIRNNNPALPPIICTHAGLTGIEKHDARFYAKRPKMVGDMFAVENFKPLGWLEKTSFNVSTINLFNEDVRAILLSNGLIGVSLDRRIIGFVESFEIDDVLDIDFLSKGEFDFLYGNNPAFKLGNRDIFDINTLSVEDKQQSIMLDLRYFFNQVIHILQIADKMGMKKQAAKSICLGSDFDGMIDPVNCCLNAGEYSNFFKLAKREWPDIAAEIDFELDGIENLVEDIFVNNGPAFVLKHIDKIKK